MKGLTIVLDLKGIEQLEAELRQGNALRVRETLRKLSHNEIPDRLLVRVSQLCRRIDFASKGLLLLRDRVLDLPSVQTPDAAELCEYAACLIKVGASAEALRLLQTIDVKKAPEAHKFMGFANIHKWNYQAAIPDLKNYLSKIDSASYDHLIGSLNLAASFVVTEQLDEATPMLESIEARAKKEGHLVIQGNCYELLAQTLIQRREFEAAEVKLDLALEALKNASPRYRLYIDKWRAVIAISKNNQSESAQNALRTVREQAVLTYEWEVIRDCDFYESGARADAKLFLHLYFGTPHSSYRERIKGKCSFVEIPESYVVGSLESERTLDLQSGTAQKKSVLKKGQALHKIATALLLDFYAPASVAQLFAQVFETERYHPEISPHRIQELVRRLRVKLQNSGYPIPINSLTRGYKVDVADIKNFGIELAIAREVQPSLLNVVQKHFGSRSFTLRELMDRVEIPHTTLYRQVKELVESGSLSAIGSAKNTQYIVNSATLKKAVSS
jgi:tetratricopeptide (TPR) repeat protein